MNVVMNLERVLQNRTPMVVTCSVLDDRHGREQVVLVAKLTWCVSATGEVSIAADQAPMRPLGAFHAEPATSPRYAADLRDEVPGTDVLLVGTAYPHAPRATSTDVVLEVADSEARRLMKTVRVYGPRVWQKSLMGVSVSPPAELTPTPLRYENTWGGYDATDPDNPQLEVRNPVGSGIACARPSLIGTTAPALEHPDHPLGSRHPAPAAFAPIGTAWEPCASRMGSHDEAWRRERAPLKPLDFNPRANNAAPDDQHCDPPLRGDEMFGVTGVLPAGKRWQFRLPLYRPVFFAQLRHDEHKRQLETHLDTVSIDADEGRVELVWRACTPLPRVPQMLKLLQVASFDPLPAAMNEQILAIAQQEQAV